MEGIFVGYFDNSKAYKIWVPRTHTILKSHDVIFDESNHIEQVTIHSTVDDDLPNLWTANIPSHTTTIEVYTPTVSPQWSEGAALPFATMDDRVEEREVTEEAERSDEEEQEATEGTPDEQEIHAPKDFERGPWLDP